MLITAVCPYCRDSYHVEPTLRGQALRCKNDRCRKVFIVEKGEGRKPGGERIDSSRPAPTSDNGSHSVEEFVPVLPAEIDRTDGPATNHVSEQLPLVPVERAEPEIDLSPALNETAPEAASWYDAPPPVRRDGVEAPEPRTTKAKTTRREAKAPDTVRRPAKPTTNREAEPAFKPNPPVAEPPATAWEPPPVRREVEAEKASPAEHVDEVDESHSRRRGAKLAIFLMLLTLFGGLGGLGYWVLIILRVNEEKLATEAHKDYGERIYQSAEDKFAQLEKEFPNSERNDEYKFWHRLSRLRRVLISEDDHELVFSEADTFVDDFKDDDRFKDSAKDMREGVVTFTDKLSAQFAQVNDDGPLVQLERVGKTVDSINKAVGKGKGFTPEELAKINDNSNKIIAAVQKWKRRLEVLAQLDRLKSQPFPGNIRQAQDLATRELPGDAEALQKVQELYDLHFKSIVYKQELAELPKAVREDDVPPSIIVDPLVRGAPGAAPANDPVVLALARGVLYGLKKSNGQARWALRVGVDTTTLPVRVPAGEAVPERILVLSSDRQTLAALDSDGTRLWEYRLDSPCLGRPAIDGRRAYLCTFDGRVHEIELIQGRLLGRFYLGQRLSLGPTFDDKTKRLYVAGDDSCVYVLDTRDENKRCESVLYTGHPSGSLRSEPLITLSAPPEVPSYLVLSQADGLDACRLRAFALPIADRHAPPALRQEPRLSGWPWFRLHHDPEKIALLSDAGVLGLFGIRQRNNTDEPIFPLLNGPEQIAGQPNPGVPLANWLPPDPRGKGRALVAHVQAEDLWVIVHGKLQYLRVGWGAAQGPQIVPGWNQPLEIGSPLHDSQVEENRNGATLYLVTQALARPTCVATAVDAATGQVHWQRQIGLVCQGEPLALQAQGGRPVILAMDQAGALFAFDTQQQIGQQNAPWQSRGKMVPECGGLDDNPAVSPLLLPGAKPGTALQIACPGKGTHLIVRQLEVSKEGVVTATVAEGALPAPLAGTPAYTEARLVLPLANGVLVWIPLPWDGKTVHAGPNWRARTVDPQAPGHATALDADRFVTNDGGVGLTVWEWTQPAVWKSYPEDKAAYELSARVVAAPLLISPGANGKQRLVVGDSAGTLTLLVKEKNHRLTVSRTWKLPGRITAGPFLIGDGMTSRVGCIVDQRQLVCIDPAKSEILWRYQSPDGKRLVGLPGKLKGKLLVVDQTGRYVALYPADGKPVSNGYKLQGSLAPAATPVLFDEQHLFAPLSDGTIMLLPVERLVAAEQDAGK